MGYGSFVTLGKSVSGIVYYEPDTARCSRWAAVKIVKVIV